MDERNSRQMQLVYCHQFFKMGCTLQQSLCYNFDKREYRIVSLVGNSVTQVSKAHT